MKKLTLATATIIIMTISTTAHSKVIRPKDNDPVLLSQFLCAIGFVESGNKNIGIHNDGESYGKYGVTKYAVNELKRVKLIPIDFRTALIKLPFYNKLIAEKYLNLLFHRCGSWYKAVGMYHGGDKKRRNAYADKVFNYVINKNRNTTNEKEIPCN